MKDRYERHYQQVEFTEEVIKAGIPRALLSSFPDHFCKQRLRRQNWTLVFISNPEMSYQVVANNLGLTRQRVKQLISIEIKNWWMWSDPEICKKFPLEVVTDFNYRKGPLPARTRKLFLALDQGHDFNDVIKSLGVSRTVEGSLRSVAKKYGYSITKSKRSYEALKDSIDKGEVDVRDLEVINPASISRFKVNYPEQTDFKTLGLVLSGLNVRVSKKSFNAICEFLRSKGVNVFDQKQHPKGTIHHVLSRDQQVIQDLYLEWLSTNQKRILG